MIELLRTAVRRSGRSLNELGRVCGVDATRLSRFLRGQRTLILPAAERLCEALGYTLTKIGRAPKEKGADKPSDN